MESSESEANSVKEESELLQDNGTMFFLKLMSHAVLSSANIYRQSPRSSHST